MLSIILFYLAAFLMGFALCIMPGPVAIEVFHNVVKKENNHALSVGLGAAIGDALWAMVAFFGITPFLANEQANHLEGIFLLVAAVVTLIIGLLAIKDAGLIMKLEQKEEALIQRLEQKQKPKRKRKRWSILKGFTMVLLNPLGIGSWIIVLSFLKKVEIYIPLHLSYEIFFVLAVMTGAFSYSVAMVLITKRIKSVFEPERTARIIRILGYLLIVFSLYFLFYAVRAFFFK